MKNEIGEDDWVKSIVTSLNIKASLQLPAGIISSSLLSPGLQRDTFTSFIQRKFSCIILRLFLAPGVLWKMFTDYKGKEILMHHFELISGTWRTVENVY